MSAIMTLDVEDWHHANFRQLRGKEGLILTSHRELRYPVTKNLDLWMETLAAAGAKSTCFVLGEFAQNYPEAVKKLATQGHEIASHSLTHDLIYEMTREQFREALKKALGILGNLTGKAPLGFRAPSWSVDSRTPWFCEELERAGLRYDSSEFPIKTPLFGDSHAPTRPYQAGKLLRIPVTVIELGGARIPFSSGAFFRLAPLPMIRYGFRHALRKGKPAMAVLHPRELDPGHPRLPITGFESKVHYARLATTLPKLQAVLKMMKWTSIEEAFL
jgi:polysaccharide deacetylase family protein (PEP-CTERM system associated)